MAVRQSQESKKPSFRHLQGVDQSSSTSARHGAPADSSDGAEDIDPVVLDAVRVQSAANDFDVQRAFRALQLGDFDPTDANEVARKLFPDLDGAALNVAADRLWRHVQEHAHESSLPPFHQTLAPLLSPAPVDRQPVDDGARSASDSEEPERPVSPETALQQCIHQLDSGKYTDTYAMVSQAFSGVTGRPLLEQLQALEQHVKGSALDAIEKGAVLNVINRLRQADPSGAWRKLRLQGIRSLGPVQDLGNRVVQQMHQAGESAQAIHAFLDELSASALMEALGRLLDPSTWVDPVLVQLAKDRMHLVNLQERATVLAPLIDWHEGGCTGAAPPLPIQDDAPASMALLRQLVLVAEQDEGVAPDVSRRLREALKAYRAAVDAVTPRGHADSRWIKQVRMAMNLRDPVQEVLEVLLKHCGSRTTVAVALDAAMQHPDAWTPEEWKRLRRIVAEWYAIEGKPLQVLVKPGTDETAPAKLKIGAEKMPKRKAGREARDHYHAKQQAVAEHQRIAFADAQVVRRLLSEQLHLAGASDDDLCVQLLATSPMPVKRLLLALAIVASDLRVKEQPLAQRLMNMMDRAVPSVMQVKPLSAKDKLTAAASILANGLREGSAHWVGAGVMRTAVMYAGPWGTIVLTFVSTGVLPFLASRYLHSLESPDYKMHPRKVVRFLLDVMPGLGAVGGIAFSLYVGIQYGVFSEKDVHTVLIGLAAGNLGRFLIRQPIQSWTQSWLTRGFALVDRQGNPPSEAFQYRFNILRDLFYTLPYIAASVCTPELVRGMADDLFPVLDDLASVLAHSFVMTFPGAAVEVWDGMVIDIGLAVAAALMADYILQRGTQPNPGHNWGHWMRQGLARTVAMGVSDFLSALVAILLRQGHRSAALVLAALAGGAGGACGAVRSRLFNYVMTVMSTVENGSVLPDGLITFMGRGVVFLGSGVAHACGALSSLLGEGVPARFVSESTENSDSSTDSDEEYFDPETDEV